MAPHYLAVQLNWASSVAFRQRLRSASTSVLIVPRTVYSTIGDRAFCVTAAWAWNTSTPSVQSSESLTVFQGRLKTEPFSHSFPDWLYQCLFNGFVTQFTTLKSLDYDVVMTFRFNNNNNNHSINSMHAVHIQFNSSVPLRQSAWPSQVHSSGMHFPPTEHWKWSSGQLAVAATNTWKHMPSAAKNTSTLRYIWLASITITHRVLLLLREQTLDLVTSFLVAGPRIWNSLPASLRQPDIEFGRFKRLLKTFLFGETAAH